MRTYERVKGRPQKLPRPIAHKDLAIVRILEQNKLKPCFLSSIQVNFSNLAAPLFLLPSKLSKDWQQLKKFCMDEAERTGLTPNAIWHQVRKGKWHETDVQTMSYNRRVVFAKKVI